MSKPEFASAQFTVGQLNALVKIVGTDNVPGILSGDLKVEVKQFDLLTPVASMQVEAIEKFVASEHREAANIGYMWDDFKAHFANLVEENVRATTIVVSRLEKDSLDKPILERLGDKARIKLAHFVTLLKKQAHGEDGVLLTDGRANIAYIEDDKGTLWAVHARWSSYYRYWGVYAHSVENPYPWHAGHQILSC